MLFRAPPTFPSTRCAACESEFAGNAALLSTLPVFGPFFVQIQPHVGQGVLFARDVTQIHADLTIVDFAQPTAPLSRNADRFLSLLLERRGIENQHPVRRADSRANLPDKFHDQRAIVPRRLSDELLHGLPILIVKVRNGFGVLPFHVGEQTTHVFPNVSLQFAAGQAGGEWRRKRLQPFQHSLGDAFIQNRIVQQFLQPNIKSPFHRLLLS